MSEEIQTEIVTERTDEEIKAMFAQANSKPTKKLPKWKGNINVAAWENEDGSIFLKIGEGITARLNLNK